MSEERTVKKLDGRADTIIASNFDHNAIKITDVTKLQLLKAVR